MDDKLWRFLKRSSAAYTLENAYLFAGEQRDIETGLDYLRARYYDPTLGRFISRDAYAGNLSDPMSQHKYQYAHANPVVNTDPSGYATNLTELAALAAMTAILGGLVKFKDVGCVGESKTHHFHLFAICRF